MSACNIWCETLCQSCPAKCRAVYCCDLRWRVLNILTSMGVQKLTHRNTSKCLFQVSPNQYMYLFDNTRMRFKYQLSFFRIAFESLPTLHSQPLRTRTGLLRFCFCLLFSLVFLFLFFFFFSLQRYWLSCGSVEVAQSVAASYSFLLAYRCPNTT